VTRQDYRFFINAPNDSVRYFEFPADLSDLVNAGKVVGGAAKAPNLLYNPSFELPLVAGDQEAGNLLSNPSFESGTDEDADDWTKSSGAARSDHSDSSPRTGDWFMELDSVGEYVEQTAPVQTVGAGDYILKINGALNQSPGSAVLEVTLEAHDSGDSFLADLIPGVTFTFTATSYVEASFQRTAPASTAKLYLKLRYASGTKDLNLDDIQLYPVNGLGQDGWAIENRGLATSQTEWAQEKDADLASPLAYDGCYNVRVKTDSTDGTDANVVWLHPNDAHWISVRPSTGYKFQVWLRSDGNLSFRLGAEQKDSQGKITRTWDTAEATVSDGNWYRFFFNTITTGSAAVALRPIIEFREDGSFDVDAADLFETGLDDRVTFLDGEQVSYYGRADDALTTHADLQTNVSSGLDVKATTNPFSDASIGKLLYVTSGTGWTPGYYAILDYNSGSGYVTLDAAPASAGVSGGVGVEGNLPGLSTDAQDSISTYGLREPTGQLEASGVTDVKQLKIWLVGFLNHSAVPARQGRLTIEDCAVHIKYLEDDDQGTACGMIAIGGAEVAIPDQFPAKIKYTLTDKGTLRCDVDLTNVVPDRDLLILKALKGLKAGSVTGGSVNLSRPTNTVSAGGDIGLTITATELNLFDPTGRTSGTVPTSDGANSVTWVGPYLKTLASGLTNNKYIGTDGSGNIVVKTDPLTSYSETSTFANVVSRGASAGAAITTQNIIPDSDSVRTLGDGTHYWFQGYFANLIAGSIDASSGPVFAQSLEIGTSAVIQAGTGSPQSAVTGNVGDLWLQIDGGAGTTLWVKESGNATNTGWTGK
jgi:hypothetical protein